MTDREEIVALANECQFVGSGKTGCNPYQLLCRAADALRSTARTGPDVAGFEACREAALAAVKSRRWSEETKATTNGARTYGNEEACDFIAAAIAAIPAPATAPEGEEVTESELASILFGKRNRGSEQDHDHAARMSRALLSTFTITRKSKSEERS